MTPVPKFGLCLFEIMLQKTRFMILEQVLKYLYLDAYPSSNAHIGEYVGRHNKEASQCLAR